MAVQFVTYFGYGSLVNRDTRPINEQAFPARLYGWRRVWGHRVQQLPEEALPGSRRSCCSLTIEKCAENPDTQDNLSTGANTRCNNFIDGVVVTIPVADLPALDQRENGYDRLQLTANEFDLPASCVAQQIHVYVSKMTHSGRSNIQYPILQSYVDCVLAGYCAVFEQRGMQQFVESTAGWDGVIENERRNPRYPRAVRLPDSQLELFDSVVNNHRSD